MALLPLLRAPTPTVSAPIKTVTSTATPVPASSVVKAPTVTVAPVTASAPIPAPVEAARTIAPSSNAIVTVSAPQAAPSSVQPEVSKETAMQLFSLPVKVASTPTTGGASVIGPVTQSGYVAPSAIPSSAVTSPNSDSVVTVSSAGPVAQRYTPVGPSLPEQPTCDQGGLWDNLKCTISSALAKPQLVETNIVQVPAFSVPTPAQPYQEPTTPTCPTNQVWSSALATCVDMTGFGQKVVAERNASAAPSSDSVTTIVAAAPVATAAPMEAAAPSCPRGQFYSQSRGRCAGITESFGVKPCPEGSVWSDGAQQCIDMRGFGEKVVAEFRGCTKTQVWSPALGKCVDLLGFGEKLAAMSSGAPSQASSESVTTLTPATSAAAKAITSLVSGEATSRPSVQVTRTGGEAGPVTADDIKSYPADKAVTVAQAAGGSSSSKYIWLAAGAVALFVGYKYFVAKK